MAKPTAARFDVDDSLSALPLLAFAESLAPSLGGLIVDDAELPVAGLGGLFHWSSHSKETGSFDPVGLIMLDRVQIAELGFTLEQTWAHELGHAVDLVCRRQRQGSSKKSHRRRERFADAMGAWLLEHEPAHVYDALHAVVPIRQSVR